MWLVTHLCVIRSAWRRVYCSLVTKQIHFHEAAHGRPLTGERADQSIEWKNCFGESNSMSLQSGYRFIKHAFQFIHWISVIFHATCKHQNYVSYLFPFSGHVLATFCFSLLISYSSFSFRSFILSFLSVSRFCFARSTTEVEGIKFNGIILNLT